jgi:hypothetical protein
MDFACNCLATVAWDMYSQYVWRLNRRITCWCTCASCYCSSLDGACMSTL